MGRISVLPYELTNRIAAGEVVERPSSVVKELVENSLDARASRVEVVIEAGGRGLVAVGDDGEGMGREDLLLSIQRHATSKLASAEDLESIRTLGFRGEALAAIASVSLMSLTTSEHEDGLGWKLSARAGTLEMVEEAPSGRGTRVEVLSLFFNTPARRKFLRSEQRESALVAETVRLLALAHPSCGFSLVADGRQILASSAGQTREERVRSLIVSSSPLLRAVRRQDGVEIEAYIGNAGESRPDRSHQRLLVNGRPVKDRAAAHAIAQAYGPVLPPGRYPIVVLYIDLPPETVDVNVHPAKSEVRFRKPGSVHNAVFNALKEALRGAGALPSFDAFVRPPNPSSSWSVEGAPRRGQTLPLEPVHSPRRVSVAEPAGASWTTRSTEGGLRAAADAFEPPVVLAQYRESYIVAAEGDALLLIDQHAAHERVLFEELLERFASSAAPVQPLLIPAVAELEREQFPMLEQAIESLRALGFELEPFGGTGVLIRSLPDLFAGRDPSRLLQDILTDLSRGRLVIDGGGEDGAFDTDPEDRRFPGEDSISHKRRVLMASAACQAAIKVNFPLTFEKMRWLVEALGACRIPTTCPHGRPVSLRVSHSSIEKGFLRA